MNFFSEVIQERYQKKNVVGSFCLNISILTMDVQKEGIIKVWVPSHQEANSPQGN
jgi:hypothetical protein